jgi:hypothetical protein
MSHPAECASTVQPHTVQRSDWRKYREIRLAALKDAPAEFPLTAAS